MSFVSVLLSVPDSATTMQNLLQLNVAAQQYDDVALDTLIGDMIDGAQISYTKVSTGSLQAFGTLTVSSTGPTNGQTATVANVTLTAETSGANPTLGQFNINASPTLVASGIATAINSVPALVGIVTATSALGVVTITAVRPGASGNGLELSAGSLSNTVASPFASGSDGSLVAVNYGAAS